MTVPQSRRALIAGLMLVVWLMSAPPFLASDGMPSRLADGEFWHLVDSFSEPAGFFNSDNLVSNEDGFVAVIPDLVQSVEAGGVYVGVGPDQNFTYIAAVSPAAAFVVDVRRGNLQLHLLYKALFALSANRAEFLSRLFSRPAPRGLARYASAEQLMDAFGTAVPDPARFDANLRSVFAFLERHRGRRLDESDRLGIEFVYRHFFVSGPDLAFVSNAGFRRTRYPSFAVLQTATDLDGVPRAYLASEALFQRVKSLQARNLIIPVVGNFAGPGALAAVGDWVRARGGTIQVFYTSNVEQYLFQDGVWDRFLSNVARMPVNAASTFIRSCFNSCSEPGGRRAVTLLGSVQALIERASMGGVVSYRDVLNLSRKPGF